LKRYAIYWTPEPSHPLWRAGCDWLGRDPWTDADGTPPPDRREPWRYGFHATLKPPFALRDDAEPDAFVAAVAGLASRLRRFEMPPLQVSWLRGFLALTPAREIDPDHPLRRLADPCVRELDDWRRASAPDELERRGADPSLDDEQRALVARWGYAFVFAHWRFHMTLSDTLPERDSERRRRIERDANEHFAAALAQPIEARSLSVFVEPKAGAPLRLACRLPLAK